jgi:NAD(P)H-flavin reductase
VTALSRPGVEAMESKWLQDAIRFSLRASPTSVFTDSEGPPEQRDPRFRKLIEGILFSRELVLTYHLTIFVVILFISSIHWAKEVQRWRKRRAARFQLLGADDAYDGDAIKKVSLAGTRIDEDFEEASSSGSSTLAGTVSPPRKDVDEDTPLLPRKQIQPARGSITSSIRAFLMYQPKPVPFFNKTLPSNGTSIVIMAFICLNIFYTIFNIRLTIFELFVFADRCGLLFASNLPLLYLLAAKTQPLKLLTDSSYESLNIFHRRLGEILCLEALLHSVGMFGVWYTILRSPSFTFTRFLFEKVIILGIGTFICYELLYFTSLASFRQRWYELFLGLHVVLQVAALTFLFFHHPRSRLYVGIALCIFLIDRLVYRLGLKSLTVEASASIMEDRETVRLSSLIVKRPRSRIIQTLGRSIKDGWQATDHVFVTIPSIGRGHILQAHPFTIASPAPRATDEEARLDLLIRAQDGFSRQLLKHIQRLEHHHASPTISLRLDGPYGSSHARSLLADSDLAVVVAGGSGIAVAWPLINHLLNISRSTDTEIAPTSALRRQKIVLVWVVHKASHIKWVGQKILDEVANMGVEIVVPRATEEVGRPDLNVIMMDIVEEWGKVKDGKKIRVIASGPDSMGRVVRNICSELVREGCRVDVAIEKFGW